MSGDHDIFLAVAWSCLLLLGELIFLFRSYIGLMSSVVSLNDFYRMKLFDSCGIKLELIFQFPQEFIPVGLSFIWVKSVHTKICTVQTIPGLSERGYVRVERFDGNRITRTEQILFSKIWKCRISSIYYVLWKYSWLMMNVWPKYDPNMTVESPLVTFQTLLRRQIFKSSRPIVFSRELFCYQCIKHYII